MYDLTYLSFGAGVQSSALLALSALGLRGVPRADLAIFADTGCEPWWVYRQVEAIRGWGGIPLHVVSKGNLAEDVTLMNSPARRGGRKHFASIPMWTPGKGGKEAPLKRQCTTEYKLEVIQKEVRRVLGRTRRRIGKLRARALVGISADEAGRMKPSRVPWIDNCYPLVDAGITRAGCEQALRELGLPIPKKSACRVCPYHDDEYWHDLKTNHPEEWEAACRFDEANRSAKRSGVDGPVHLHRSLAPLREAELDPRPKRYPLGLFDSGFGGECEGVCGV